MNTTKFTLGVDLDGVTLQYNETFRNWLLDTNRKETLPEIATHYCFVQSGWFHSVDEYRNAHNEFVMERGFRTLPQYPGASEILHRLNDEYGVNIRIITHRLFKGGTKNLPKDIYEIIAEDTIASLRKNHIPFNDFCMIESKADINVDLMVDDAPHNIQAMADNNTPVLIFDQVYNQHLNYPRAKNWQEVYNVVKSHIENT